MNRELVLNIVEHTNPPGINGKLIELRVAVIERSNVLPIEWVYDKAISVLLDAVDNNDSAKAKAFDNLLGCLKEANKLLHD